MSFSPPALRLAVLIDADNTSPKAAQKLFSEIAKLGKADVKYICGTDASLAAWKGVLETHALTATQVQAGKNEADIAIVIKAMDLMHTKTFGGFCLVSSDKDFTRLAMRLKEENLAVYGFGKETAQPKFKESFDDFIPIYESANKKPLQKTAEVSVKKPPVKKEPIKTAPVKKTAAAQTAKPAATPPKAAAPIPKDVVGKVFAAYEELKKEAGGKDVTLSNFGTKLKTLGVDYKRYKNKHGKSHASLSKFLKSPELGFAIDVKAPSPCVKQKKP